MALKLPLEVPQQRIHTCSHMLPLCVQGVGSKQSLMDLQLILEVPQRWNKEACVFEPHLSPDAALAPHLVGGDGCVGCFQPGVGGVAAAIHAWHWRGRGRGGGMGEGGE